MPLYTITFKDNSIFKGGDTVEDSKWTEIPDKPIQRLEYFLDKNSSIVLQNFEKYATFTEAADTFVAPMKKCPKCGSKSRLSKIMNKVSSRLVVRCSNKECNWMENLTNNEKRPRARYKYVMGLKNGIVTSYRINLQGQKGKDKYLEGDLTKRNYPKGKEYKDKPIADWVWKKGIK